MSKVIELPCSNYTGLTRIYNYTKIIKIAIISKLQAISKPFIPKHSILVSCRNDIGYSETRLG